MPGKNQTFIATPMKIRAGSPSNVRAALLKIDSGLAHGQYDTDVTSEEQIALWTNFSEWCAQNLAALEGRAGNRTAGANG